MKRHAAALLLTLLLVPALALAGEDAPAGADRKDWIPLFDGKSLEGWVPKITGYDVGVNFGNTFRVENGVLKVAYDQYDTFGGRFGHLFYKTPFSHYRLVVEYRFVGAQAKDGPDWAFRNSGAMIHGQPVETMQKDQDFPISIEVQLLGGRGDGKPRPTANLCTPGTNVVMDGKLVTAHCVESTSKTFDGDQWVRVEVEVHGGRRHHPQGERGDGPLLREAADRRRQRREARPRGEEGRPAARERVDLAPGREPPGRVPQGGAAEPGRLHRQEVEELPAVLREVRPGGLPVAGRPRVVGARAPLRPVATPQTSGVLPGIATSSGGRPFSSMWGGVRSSFEEFMTQSQLSARPV